MFHKVANKKGITLIVIPFKITLTYLKSVFYSGRKGIQIEHKEFTLVDFEEFSLQIIGLLDSIEAMRKSGEKHSENTGNKPT